VKPSASVKIVQQGLSSTEFLADDTERGIAPPHKTVKDFVAHRKQFEEQLLNLFRWNSVMQ
jgi:hypothetical protein